MSKLIIVESPGKIKTIKKYAGPGYDVMASIGHIKDLPKKELGVDVKDDFKLKFVVNDDKRDVVADLKRSAKNADRVFLATDPDREGECIAQHLAEELNVSGDCRITFNEITESAIKDALKHPRKINKEKVDAQTTRRVVDRLVGYTLSPFLWRHVAPGTSAGRVQSAALLLISQKEREIRKFKSNDYWTIEANIQIDAHKVVANVVDESGKIKEFASEAEAKKAVEEIKANAIQYIATDTKMTTRSPYPPFTTSSLQQACSSFLKMSASQTMQHAQKLYEGIDVAGQGQTALITYMRTDSTRSAPEAITSARDHISSNFDKKYLPTTARAYVAKKKGAQDAHEAIRPTHIDILATSVSNRDMSRMYDIIWKRFVASQMSDAKIEQTRIRFKAKTVFLEAKGSRIEFDGFLAVYPIGIEEQTLPKIKDPKDIKATTVEDLKHTTQPPKRFSEAQLVKTLEKEGIGRPSTYASIIKNIVDRGYVVKQKESFWLTDMGLLVNDQLQRSFPEIISLKFTSEMEQSLDEIEDGKKWKDVVSTFYGELKDSLKNANKTEKVSIKTDAECSKCKSGMIIKYGRNGRFLACSDYPKCKETCEISGEVDLLSNIDQYSDVGVKVDRVAQAVSEKDCPKCGSGLKRRQSKFGPFWGCTGYPECKYVENIRVSIIPCPDCETGNIVEKGKKDKTGNKFYACDAYPDCKKIYSHKPIDEKCETCEDHVVIFKKKKICVNKECKNFVQTNFKRGKGKKDGNGSGE